MEIAARMAARLAGALSGNQFVDTWLAINAGLVRANPRAAEGG